MRNNPTLQRSLEQLGLSADETSIFLCLLEAPKTPLEVSRTTNIARSNVYRLVDGLMEKSILHEVTLEDGKRLAAAQPEALELLVIQQENAAQAQRGALNDLLPMLNTLSHQGTDFSIKTYSGVAGLKQMLWNELKTKGEIQIFSPGSLNLALGKAWAEKFRAEIIRRGIKQRSIQNHPTNEPTSTYKEYAKYYQLRFIPEKILNINSEITIHDHSIFIYNSWTHDIQLGTEIKNPFLATFMRQVFEHYWALAEHDTKQKKT